MSEPDKPKPPADPLQSTPKKAEADSTTLASAHVPAGPDTVQAFISYASADSSIANVVCRALEGEGVKCWIAPRDVTPGELYAGNIVHAIDSTRVVVLVLSQHAADSGHVLREVERASSKRHPIVSFRIDLTPLPDDFAYFLNTSQWLDASATGVDRALPRLVEAVKSALGKPMAARVAHPPVKVKASRRPSHIILPLALIVAGILTYFAVDSLWLSKRDDSQKALVAATPASPADSSGASSVPAKSIAVLPFADMSAEKNQEYMSDGIAEELLNLLAQIPDLKVIARTSSFAFKGQNIDIAEIAKKLNVTHVLEGSVRTSGKKMRITAQLIRAADGTHLWSGRYDRPMDDIFAVQDEIANAVVSELKIKLLGAPPKSKQKDSGAYALFLQAREVGYQATASAFEQAITLYQQALALDPKYAEAWDGLAYVYGWQSIQGLRSSAEAFGLATEAAKKALEVDPQYAPAHARLGWIAVYYDRDYELAARHLSRALALDSSSADILLSAGIFARRLGRSDQAIELGKRAIARDPVNSDAHFELANAYKYARQWDAAIQQWRTVLTLSPSALGAHGSIGEVLVLRGSAESALAEIKLETDDAWRLGVKSIAHHALGQSAESEAAFAELRKKHSRLYSYTVAEVAAYRGDPDHAFEWLEKAAQLHDPSFGITPLDPFIRNLHDDPRWLPFLRKHGMAPEQLAAVRFDVKLP